MAVPLAEAPLAYALMLIIPMISLYGLKDQSFAESGLFHVHAVKQERQYYRLVTPAFLHADLLHLLVNMLTFFFFAPFVEVIYGTAGLAILFLGAQLGAQGYTLLRRQQEPDYRALGASGAVSGILLAFCVFAPMERLYLLGLIPMPAFLFAILYIGYTSYAMGGPGRVAHEAHLGGAVAGVVIALILPTLV